MSAAARQVLRAFWPSGLASFIKDAYSCQLIFVSCSPDNIESFTVGLKQIDFGMGGELSMGGRQESLKEKDRCSTLFRVK